MNKGELKLFDSKNPKEYIMNSVKSRLDPSKKAALTKLWLTKKTKYTIEDIKYARNRHPYWKKRKGKGGLERTQKRIQEHDYTNNVPVIWDKENLKEFINMNKKDKNSIYINKDFELAKHFSTTIPSIQYLRRKHNIALKILTKQKKNVTVKRVYDLIVYSEQVLKKKRK